MCPQFAEINEKLKPLPLRRFTTSSSRKKQHSNIKTHEHDGPAQVNELSMVTDKSTKRKTNKHEVCEHWHPYQIMWHQSHVLPSLTTPSAKADKLQLESSSTASTQIDFINV